MTQIKFGTSGWRGVIADDFTFERSRLVVAAIADYMSETGEDKAGILVGYDTRFLAEEFAADAAELLSGLGMQVFLCTGPVPTPAVSAVILSRGLGGAVNFTASHNPGHYQGIKFSPSWGGPALPESTKIIEEKIRLLQNTGLPVPGTGRGTVTAFDPAPEYLEQLKSKVNTDAIAGSGLKVAFDALHGAGGGYLDRLLEETGCNVAAINCNRDPFFGGAAPEPSEERLTALSEIVSSDADLGLSTDGDADRFGILGNRGEFYTPNSALAFFADYLLRVRETPGDLARSVATTMQLDDVAAAFGRKCHETPVGFKYIGQMISRDMLALGGEESAGMSIYRHIPEKDGILACLLAAELVAVTGRNLSEVYDQVQERYGRRFSVRINLRLNDQLASSLRGILSSPPLEVGEFTASRLVTVDGTKWIYDGGDWVLLRLSGTEPVARVYVETSDHEKLAALEKSFVAWIRDGEGSETADREGDGN